MRYKQFISESQARIDAVRQRFIQHVTKTYHTSSNQVIHPDLLASYHKMFDDVVLMDPTHNKAYIQWLSAILTIPGNGRLFEDRARVTEALKLFDKHKHRLPVERRDINKIKRYHDLEELVRPFEDVKSGKEIKRDEIAQYHREITTLYDGSDGKVYVPHTERASIFLGRGTKWCTAATTSANYFKEYNRDGNLFVIILPNGQKWQFWNKKWSYFWEGYVEAHESGSGFNQPRFEKILEFWQEEFQLCDERDVSLPAGCPTRQIANLVVKAVKNNHNTAIDTTSVIALAADNPRDPPRWFSKSEMYALCGHEYGNDALRQFIYESEIFK